MWGVNLVQVVGLSVDHPGLQTVDDTHMLCP